MTEVSVKDAKNRFTELGRKAEAGERIVVTRNGKPAFDIVPHKPKAKGGTDWEAGERYLKSLGVDRLASWISPDFDDPLPEDFLLRPLPPERPVPLPPRRETTKKAGRKKVAKKIAPSAR